MMKKKTEGARWFGCITTRVDHLGFFAPSLFAPCSEACLADVLRRGDGLSSRPTISQFYSFEIRPSMFPNYIKFVDRRIVMLKKCEMVGWAAYGVTKHYQIMEP